MFSEHDRADLLRSLATRWREALRAPGIAAVLDGEPAFTARRVRDAAARWDAAMPVRLQAPEDLLAPCGVALEGGEAERFVGAVSPLLATATRLLSAPSADAVEASLRTAGFTLSALDRVREVLAAARRARSEALWRRIDRVKDLAVTHVGETRPAASAERGGEPPPRARILRGKVHKDQERLTRAGEEAEADALSLVMRDLVAIWREPERGAFQEAVGMLMETLQGAFEDDPDAPCLPTHLAHGRALLAGVDDEDDLVEHLAGLLHVSAVSDMFGFDLLGWIALRDGAPREAAFLEVKSASSASFIITRTEWERARAHRALRRPARPRRDAAAPRAARGPVRQARAGGDRAPRGDVHRAVA